jgi:predicted Zn-dependent protease
LDSNSGNEIVLFIYHQLTNLFPENPIYLTLLGNAYLSKELDGLALEAYERANGIAGEKQGWIVANIGNMLTNKGCNPLAISYLKKALVLDPESSYAHERLSQAIKNQEGEREKLGTILKSAKGSFYSSLSEAQAITTGSALKEFSKDA